MIKFKTSFLFCILIPFSVHASFERGPKKLCVGEECEQGSGILWKGFNEKKARKRFEQNIKPITQIPKKMTQKIKKKKKKRKPLQKSFEQKQRDSALKWRAQQGSNLPQYTYIDRSQIPTEGGFFHYEKTKPHVIKEIQSGMTLIAFLEQAITAYPDESSTVVAYVKQPETFENYRFVGEAFLSETSKKIRISFSKMIPRESHREYALESVARDLEGREGLEGEYHSNSGIFFLGQLVSAVGATILDTQVDRERTFLGGSQPVRTLGNAAKQGAVTAAAKTGERFAQASEEAHQYSDLEGVRLIEIFIKSRPREIEE